MKTINVFLFWSLIVYVSTIACSKLKKEDVRPDLSLEKNTTSSMSLSSMNTEFCGDKKYHDLMAGQNTKMGNVVVYNTKDMIYVEYISFEGWYINETHLYLGDITSMPSTITGNPKLGNFPYNDSHNEVQSFIYAIPKKDMPPCFDVVAHASVVKKGSSGLILQTETAYANGSQLNTKGSWATYFNYCLQECKCTYTTITATMFAGQTIPVGTLEITNDDKNLYVSYITKENWFMSETHLYVGELGTMPVNNSNTPIPGKFPYTSNFEQGIISYMYTIPLSSLPTCYIIAAHASVYRMENGTVVQTETSWSSGTEFSDTNRWGSYTNYCNQVCN